MNKGFTLIETIIYIGLISILTIGVFSLVMNYVYTNQNKSSFSDNDYEMLIKNLHE
jgi:type II secretory pathway pseudopilin PulG